MQQYVVPQFIDVEDKVIGPITTRQFIILLVGFLIIGISYKIFDFALFITFALAMLAVAGALAFLRINGRPFHYFILNLLQTLRRPKLRIWYFMASEFNYKIDRENFTLAAKIAPEKHYAASRLAELSLIVDTRGAYRGERGDSEVKVERE
ncbi:MAG: hypothetical protein UU95_C0029G0010 [Parcubacteria group bacterium GW2011_GWC2_42_12]|uniref:PrgI family protein n=1 Tax=Candidatus Falkowbacteria bacterium RIFCSPHIGHO2_02_FULL_42_9 TaxID=1797986 RepID=A0A1F5S8U6_9BACT|nr:MAG: hypothetical protein UU95_C0029G0010 [Parcubacteria group bacterium GW2011_GWC2_42_12]OGF23079.1 MAG: hypothetical protein A3D45_01760 [Candidatus Falkowbacteria bacterium RIFCSPHIGHO2_02_FULL_42_9]